MSEHAVAAAPPEPLAPWHMVVAPRRHVADFYDLDVEEQRLVWELVSKIRTEIAAAFPVEGFEVGFVDGSPADRHHAHIHVAPRAPGQRLALPPDVEWVNAADL